jgi:hypothetical protein
MSVHLYYCTQLPAGDKGINFHSKKIENNLILTKANKFNKKSMAAFQYV